jgi:hypothetical protein
MRLRIQAESLAKSYSIPQGNASFMKSAQKGAPREERSEDPIKNLNVSDRFLLKKWHPQICAYRYQRKGTP